MRVVRISACVSERAAGQQTIDRSDKPSIGSAAWVGRGRFDGRVGHDLLHVVLAIKEGQARHLVRVRVRVKVRVGGRPWLVRVTLYYVLTRVEAGPERGAGLWWRQLM